jgi:hypothetical protein
MCPTVHLGKDSQEPGTGCPARVVLRFEVSTARCFDPVGTCETGERAMTSDQIAPADACRDRARQPATPARHDTTPARHETVPTITNGRPTTTRRHTTPGLARFTVWGRALRAVRWASAQDKSLSAEVNARARGMGSLQTATNKALRSVLFSSYPAIRLFEAGETLSRRGRARCVVRRRVRQGRLLAMALHRMRDQQHGAGVKRYATASPSQHVASRALTLATMPRSSLRAVRQPAVASTGFRFADRRAIGQASSPVGLTPSLVRVDSRFARPWARFDLSRRSAECSSLRSE